MMKLLTPTCPECGATARGSVERVPGRADLDIAPDGTTQYEGWTEIWWDEQTTLTDDQGRWNLIDDDGHEWFSAVDA